MWPDRCPAFAAAVRGARRWALWLAVALAAAHSVGAWHIYTHPVSPTGERSSKTHAVPDACVVCLAVAAIGGAPPAAPAWHLATAAHPAPTPRPTTARPRPAPARPYAIRAPPPLAS
jgi:hypothetical protein